MPRQLVYVAHPVTTYSSAHARRQLQMVKTLFPDAEVIDPSTAFASTAHWLTEWPALVRSLDAVIAVAAEDRTIGAGVARELFDAEAVGVSTAVLVDGVFAMWRGISLLAANRRTPARIGHLITGRKLAASSVVFVSAARREVPSQ